MDQEPSSTESIAALLSRNLSETVDTMSAVLTVLDIQSRILARLENRSEEDVADEISRLLRERRREAIRELNDWSDALEAHRRGEMRH
ncbi:MAG: hypothetical protein ACOCSK_03295 [Rhodothermales bacterium]